MTDASPKLRSLVRLGRYVRPYWQAVLLLLIGQVLESLYEVFFRYSFKLIVDQAIAPMDYYLLGYFLSALAAATLIYAIMSIGCDLLWAKYGLKVLNDLRHDLFVSLQGRTTSFFHGKRTGDLAARFTADASRIEDGVLYGVPMGASGLLQVLMSLGLIAQINLSLFLIGAVGLILSVALPRVVNARALAAGYGFHTQEGQLSAYIQENITAQAVIKAYGLEKKAAVDFRYELDLLLAAGLRSYFLSFLSQRVPHLLLGLVHLALFGIGATMVMGGRMSLGDLVAFQALFFGLSQSMNNVSWLIPSLIDASASLQRIIEIMDSPQVTQERPGTVQLAPLTRSIVFENVSFRYDGNSDGVEDLTVSLDRGDFTALVGPTGAGKTTIANLLLHFIEPTAGAIKIDGMDIRQVTISSLRSQIGLVPQEIILFRTSIRENIRAGLLGASDAEIEVAAEAAGIHDFILGLPQGYDTIYGQAGRQVSGGERQRIALARALVRNPRILILDEATSSLDTAAEAGIIATIRALKGRCTILAITHRLAVARAADRIMVLKAGKLVEDGCHDQLAGAHGLYTKLWRDAVRDEDI